MDRDELLHKLAEAIANDEALLPSGWRHLVLTTKVGDGTLDLAGFSYASDGRAVPVSPRDFAIFDVLEQLRDAMLEADAGRPWIAALFRIDQDRIRGEFEYHNVDRWTVTPQNLATRMREFAPT
jgi:hypothetical protein